MHIREPKYRFQHSSLK